MKGYVRNISGSPKYALKNHFLSGTRLKLDDLYLQYGEKHGLKEGEEFVKWLREVKLPDTAIWEIKYDDGSKKEEENKVTVTGKIIETSDEKIDLPKSKEPMRAVQIKKELK